MVKTSVIFFLSIILGCVQHSAPHSHPAPAAASAPFRVIGFYNGKGEDIEKYELEKLTHLIFCFTHLEGNKMVFSKADGAETLKQMVEMKGKFPKLKVLVSFGGWGDCEHCSDVFSTDSGRKEFALSVRDLLVQYKADGLDLDWESPVIGGFGKHKASPNDKENFTLLVKELRQTLPVKSEICFDANSTPDYLDNSIDWKAVMPLVDFVNMMTYGLPANARGHTGHHCALYPSEFQEESVHKCVLALDSMEIPLDKVIIGAAFYSFVAENADSINYGLGRTAKFKANVTFSKLQEDYTGEKGYSYHWDSVAQAPWLYNASLRTFVTFDDSHSVALKTAYAIEKKLGGIMFWNLKGDLYQNGLLDAIDKEIKK